MNPEIAEAIYDHVVPEWRDAPIRNGHRRVCAPYRDDKHPSLDIHEDTLTWYDRGISEGGGAHDLARRVLSDEKTRQLMRQLGDDKNQTESRPTAKSARNPISRPPADPVEIIGPVTSAQIAKLKRNRRLVESDTLDHIGAKMVHWYNKDWIGFPTLADDSWKLWGLSRNGNPRRDDRGKLERKNAGPVSLVVSPPLRENNPGTLHRLWDVEGESDFLACIDAGIDHVIATTGGAGTLSAHNLHTDWLTELRPAKVVVVRDLDDPGREGAGKACDWWRSQGVAVRILALPESLGKGGDLRDFLNGRRELNGQPAAEPLGDATALNELASGSELLLPIVQESERCDTDAKLNELARLSRIEYDQRREEEAKALKIRVATLDAEVASRRPDPSEKASTGTAVLFAEANPWPEPVDGAELLYSLAAGYKRFLALPEWSAETMALWTLAAHAHDLSQISPILAFVSPEKRCGKTTALGLLNLTCPRPLPASNITGAALFRSVEKWRPTLLVDEADTFLRDSDELRGIFNSGHNRSQEVVIRTAGEDYEPRVYSTWSPKVIAMIGSLPGTLEDRAISIPMRRRRSDERVEKFRADRNYGLGDLARQCARWVSDHSDDLRESDPEIPRALHDRASDNWRALIAIADVADGDWPETARKAAEALTPTEDESSIGTLLLTDIRDIYCDRDGPEWISSRELCEALVGLSDRAWSEIQRGGKSLTTTGLARRLKPFKVRPVQHKNSEKNARGYLFADFQEPFGRYLPTDAPASPCPSATPLPSNENRYLADPQPLPTVDGNNGGSGWESSNPAESLKGSGVALGHPEASEDKRDEWGEV